VNFETAPCAAIAQQIEVAGDVLGSPSIDECIGQRHKRRVPAVSALQNMIFGAISVSDDATPHATQAPVFVQTPEDLPVRPSRGRMGCYLFDKPSRAEGFPRCLGAPFAMLRCADDAQGATAMGGRVGGRATVLGRLGTRVCA
jgi:hypothetical protein